MKLCPQQGCEAASPAAEGDGCRGRGCEGGAGEGGAVSSLSRKWRHLYLQFSLSQVIAAEGEHKASRALKHAAEVITDSPAALQVNPPHNGARITQFRPDLDRDNFCPLKRFLCLKFWDILKCQNTNDWFQGETNRRLPTLDESPIRLHCWNFVDKTKEKKINIL